MRSITGASAVVAAYFIARMRGRDMQVAQTSPLSAHLSGDCAM
jgi:hypothetical protein